MQIKKKLKSGKDFTMRLASFDLASDLLREVLLQVKNSGVEIDLNTFNIQNIMEQDVSDKGIFKIILDSIINIIASKELQRLIFLCGETCVYDGQKFEKSILEDEAVRKDYFEICFNIIKENLSPFFSNLGSLLSKLKEKTLNSNTQE